MSKQTQEFFDQLKSGDEPSLAGSLLASASAARDVGSQIWDSMKPMFDHGRTELASAMFAGHAHVMYMKGEQNPMQDEPAIEAAKPPEMEQSMEREM